MMLPLTATMPAMGTNLGKGLVFLLTKTPAGDCTARVITVVAVYSALGIRDPELSARLGQAMMGGPAQWAAVKRLRRDAHEPGPSCWLHAPSCCLSTDASS